MLGVEVVYEEKIELNVLRNVKSARYICSRMMVAQAAVFHDG